MKFALLRCCVTPIDLKQYETSTNAVFKKLGIDLVEVSAFSCCGYPLKNYNFGAYVLSSARNLALSEKKNLNMVTMCNCCYGTVKHVDHLLKGDTTLRNDINRTLLKEGLKYEGNVEVQHLLQVLYDEVGLSNLQGKLVKTYKGLNVATHYGCHILRPSDIVEFDNPFSPTKLDDLVTITGATSVPWVSKLDCCGSPLWGVNDELSMDLTQKKLTDAKQAGADYLCVACCYCQLQFGRVQTMLLSRRGREFQLPSLLYLQLLGLCLGIEEEDLGLHLNQLPIGNIRSYLNDHEG
jgi:heterodisulfide reductase subunit B